MFRATQVHHQVSCRNYFLKKEILLNWTIQQCIYVVLFVLTLSQCTVHTALCFTDIWCTCFLPEDDSWRIELSEVVILYLYIYIYITNIYIYILQHYKFAARCITRVTQCAVCDVTTLPMTCLWQNQSVCNWNSQSKSVPLSVQVCSFTYSSGRWWRRKSHILFHKNSFSYS